VSLFDLSNDEGERIDVAGQHLEITARIDAY